MLTIGEEIELARVREVIHVCRVGFWFALAATAAFIFGAWIDTSGSHGFHVAAAFEGIVTIGFSGVVRRFRRRALFLEQYL